MKNTLILLFSCLTSASFAQSAAGSLPVEIKNSRKPAQINLPGTRLYLIPPAGFETSPGNASISKGNTAMVQVMDLVGGSFYTNAATFSKESFEQKGITVFEYKELRVNGFPAKMVFMSGAPNTKVYDLVFGDSTFSTMVMGIFDDHDAQAGNQVRQAMLSIYYDKAHKVNPFADAIFRLDDSKSAFKFVKFSGTMYLYSLGGVDKDSYAGDPYLMVVAMPDDASSLKETADNMGKAIQASETKNVSEEPVNGFPSYKRELYGKLNGEPVVMFQQIVQIGSNLVIIQGIAASDAAKYIPEFRKLAATVTKR